MTTGGGIPSPSWLLMGESTMSESGTVTIPIGGMHCQHCVISVKNKLSAMPGVEGVEVNLGKGEAVVQGKNLDVPALREAIEELGFDAGEVA